MLCVGCSSQVLHHPQNATGYRSPLKCPERKRSPVHATVAMEPQSSLTKPSPQPPIAHQGAEQELPFQDEQDASGLESMEWLSSEFWECPQCHMCLRVQVLKFWVYPERKALWPVRPSYECAYRVGGTV